MSLELLTTEQLVVLKDDIKNMINVRFAELEEKYYALVNTLIGNHTVYINADIITQQNGSKFLLTDFNEICKSLEIDRIIIDKNNIDVLDEYMGLSFDKIKELCYLIKESFNIDGFHAKSNVIFVPKRYATIIELCKNIMSS
jgi:hypothetical protein